MGCVPNAHMNPQKSALKSAGPSEGAGVRKYSKARPIAARIGLHPKTIFRWADAGKIHRHKINERTVLFDEAEIAAFIASARVSPGGAT